MDDLTAEFIAETTEALHALKPGIERLTQTPDDPAVWADMYKILRTMKGACGFLPLPRLERMAAAGEAFLTRLQQGSQRAGDHTTATLKALVARVADTMIALAETGTEPQGDDTALLQQLNDTAPPAPPAHTPVVEAPPAPRETLPAAPAETGIRVTRESLDHLVRITGELVHTRNQLLHLARERDDRELAAPLQHLSQITTQFYESVMQTRVQPMPNGATARLKVPRALTIAPVMLVEAAGDTFALPQAGLEELIATGANADHRIETVGGAEVVRLRNLLLPVLRISTLLHLPLGRLGAREYVAVLRAGKRRFGLVLDQALDTQEVVIKPLAPVLAGLRYYQGSAMLGDGRIVLVLDAQGMAEELGNAPPEMETEDEEGKRLAQPTSFLIFTAGRGGQKAVPLEQVARLEVIDSATIMRSGDEFVAPYRDGQLQLKTLPDTYIPARGTFEAIVFQQSGQTAALVTDAVLDIMFAPAGLKLSTPPSATYQASAIMNGKSTDILALGAVLPGAKEVAL